MAAAAPDVKSVSHAGERGTKANSKRYKAAESFPLARRTSFWKSVEQTSPYISWSLPAVKKLRKIKSGPGLEHSE